jgi:shikimate kinase
MPDLVLVGAPGAGKSTVGRLVAGLMGSDFADTDDLIADTAGMPVPDIFVVHGEAYFRDLEARTVLAALAAKAGVLALGGGAVASPQVRQALTGAPVVWLQVADGEAVKRVGLSGPRPMLLGNVRAEWAGLLAQRAPYYDQVARWRVDTSGRSAAEVAIELVELLRGTDD